MIEWTRILVFSKVKVRTSYCELGSERRAEEKKLFQVPRMWRTAESSGCVL
jgi:hypothetical protein